MENVTSFSEILFDEKNNNLIVGARSVNCNYMEF